MRVAQRIAGFYGDSAANLKSGLDKLQRSHDAEMAKANPDSKVISELTTSISTYRNLIQSDQNVLNVVESTIVAARLDIENSRPESEELEGFSAVEISEIQTSAPSLSGGTLVDGGDEQLMRSSQNMWIQDATSPTGYRNQATGLPGDPNSVTELEDIVVTARRSEIAVAPTDHRVRVKPLNPESFYGPSVSESNAEEQANAGHLLSIIKDTNGVIFPYTPNITYSHQINYTNGATVHANQDYQFYNNTAAVQFQISAKFTAQNEREGQYVLAAKHFFQTASKMRFGEDDDKRGLPPPMLVFSGYGDFMFNNLPVVMNNINIDLPDDQDYVQVDLMGSTSWVPAVMVFNLTFTVQQTPSKQRSFNFDRFASGELLKNRGWI